MQEKELVITRLNQKGRGIAPLRVESGTSSLDERLVAVIGAIPGDTVLAKITGRKRKLFSADLLRVIEPSPDRVELACAHAPACGGCAFQAMNYQAQLKHKQQVIDALFGFSTKPIIAATQYWHHRNKMEFSFSQNKAGEKFLGLILAGTKGHVFNLTECHLVSPWMADLLGQVRIWWEESKLAAFRLNGTGTLRTLTLREGKNTGDKLIILTVSGTPEYAPSKAQLESFVKTCTGLFSEQEREHLSIFLRIHQAKKGFATEFFEYHLFGKAHLEEKLNLKDQTLSFHISPTAFFQPNTAQAERLYQAAIDLIVWPKKHVLDLYAGAATLGIAMASKAEKVTSIELNPYACFDGEANCELNELANVEIVCGDVGKKLPELVDAKPDLVVIDPPRTGLGPDAIEALCKIKSPEILYISCNPMTQVRDVEVLMGAGYKIKAVQPVDAFPHTPHIENIVLLALS